MNLSLDDFEFAPLAPSADGRERWEVRVRDTHMRWTTYGDRKHAVGSVSPMLASEAFKIRVTWARGKVSEPRAAYRLANSGGVGRRAVVHKDGRTRRQQVVETFRKLVKDYGRQPTAEETRSFIVQQTGADVSVSIVGSHIVAARKERQLPQRDRKGPVPGKKKEAAMKEVQAVPKPAPSGVIAKPSSLVAKAVEPTWYPPMPPPPSRKDTAPPLPVPREEPTEWRKPDGRLDYWCKSLQEAVVAADIALSENGDYPSILAIGARIGIKSPARHAQSDSCYLGKIRSAARNERSQAKIKADRRTAEKELRERQLRTSEGTRVAARGLLEGLLVELDAFRERTTKLIADLDIA